jgi:hypothetical protein
MLLAIGLGQPGKSGGFVPSLPAASTRRILMLLFVPPTSFETWGEHPFHWAALSQLLASLIMIVSVGALFVTLCHALIVLLLGEPIDLQNGFGPPSFLRLALGV